MHTAHDLRHIVSPAVRDLLELAAHPDFDRTREQVQRLGGCTRPIALVGHTTTYDATRREVLHSYRTADEPTGRLLLACGNRRASRCPTCSRVYAADTYHLIRAGLVGGKTVPETVTTHPRVFATLTAPSFGPVHNRPTTPAGLQRPCRCGTWHSEDDPALGTPVDPLTYDYCGSVLFNAHAGALWARFTTYLRREIAARAGLSQRALASHLRLSFAKVAEYQKRGVVHFHAVIRLDGPEGSTEHPPAWATTALLADAIFAAATRVRLTVASDTIGDREVTWGSQIDVREIAPANTDAPLTDQGVAAYVAKYATKGAEDSGTIDRPLYCTPCRGRGATTTPTGYPTQCPHCTGTGLAELPASLPVTRHVRQLLRTCWNLGQHPEFAHLNLWKWAHMLGHRGHFSTKSRRYSTTLGALRDARRTHAAEQARIRNGHPAHDPAETLVVSDWRYLTTGYTPGEELLAETVRHNRTNALQLKSEGEVCP
ncbi:replication initiator [Streptantibioticus rubrisoli]|uniref:Replication initiation protein n=1 Tax=Streptantibioticus rubrisoli TaxID=1387313 RepID=A0ABT1PLN3_9ACTN|nr:replication initiator [Streptantibioticus rubrisoli]MCQ4046270.1 replication initiation protein [Streptantibioticus rubrisoli]